MFNRVIRDAAIGRAILQRPPKGAEKRFMKYLRLIVADTCVIGASVMHG
jgi:hypothetical protein